MNKDFESMVISREIRDLIRDVDNFINKKDELIESFKKAYLNISNKN